MTTAPGPLTRGVAVLLAWLSAAVLAGLVAWWGVSLVGRGPGGSDPVLSQQQVAAELAERQATAQPFPTATPTTESTPAAVRSWDVTGGRISAACAGSDISLLYYTADDGWAVEVKHAGPEELEVEFERDHAEHTVRATCTDGVPTHEVEVDD